MNASVSDVTINLPPVIPVPGRAFTGVPPLSGRVPEASPGLASGSPSRRPQQVVAQEQPRPRVHAAGVVLVVIMVLLGLCAWGVVRFFYLGSEATALREVAMRAAPGVWNKRFALHVGPITTAAIRAGSRLFHLPPEPRAALSAFHQGEVGVYQLEQGTGSPDRAAVLRAADKTMTSRGWVRVVGVIQPEQLVAIYLPRKSLSAKRIRSCVLVWNERDLVVVSAGGDLEPLLALAGAGNGKAHWWPPAG